MENKYLRFYVYESVNAVVYGLEPSWSLISAFRSEQDARQFVSNKKEKYQKRYIYKIKDMETDALEELGYQKVTDEESDKIFYSLKGKTQFHLDLDDGTVNMEGIDYLDMADIEAIREVLTERGCAL